jgi:hypothetical protein
MFYDNIVDSFPSETGRMADGARRITGTKLNKYIRLRRGTRGHAQGRFPCCCEAAAARYDGAIESQFQKEVGIMCSMGSEFVVQVYGIVDDSPDLPVLIIIV